MKEALSLLFEIFSFAKSHPDEIAEIRAAVGAVKDIAVDLKAAKAQPGA